MLLHYNSAVGEGKGATHVELEHRLIQIGREDLAEWLGKTVFHQLSKDLNETFLGEGSLTEPVKEKSTSIM